MKAVKLSEALALTASAVEVLAEEAGVELDILKLYTSESIKELAVIAGMLKNVLERVEGLKIEIVN